MCTPPRNWGVPGKNISRRRAPKNKSRGSLLTLKVWWKTAQWRNQQRRQIWPGKYDLAAAVYLINLLFLFHFTIECFVTEVKFWAGVKIRAEVRFGGKEEGEADNMASQLLAVQESWSSWSFCKRHGMARFQGQGKQTWSLPLKQQVCLLPDFREDSI